jgi:2-polyprenyl-3-methyl-5-hydroxy-6-metoxy-1,4-benzoquinol methylase
VDLGCGTGQHAALLARHFDEVLAVDISAPMLAHAAQYRPAGNIRYEQRDLTDVTSDADGRFDLVFCAHALHHVPDLPAALTQIRGLTRPAGRLCWSTTSTPAAGRRGGGCGRRPAVA